MTDVGEGWCRGSRTARHCVFQRCGRGSWHSRRLRERFYLWGPVQPGSQPPCGHLSHFLKRPTTSRACSIPPQRPQNWWPSLFKVRGRRRSRLMTKNLKLGGYVLHWTGISSFTVWQMGWGPRDGWFNILKKIKNKNRLLVIIKVLIKQWNVACVCLSVMSKLWSFIFTSANLESVEKAVPQIVFLGKAILLEKVWFVGKKYLRKMFISTVFLCSLLYFDVYCLLLCLRTLSILMFQFFHVKFRGICWWQSTMHIWIMLTPLCDDLLHLTPFYTCCDIRVKITFQSLQQKNKRVTASWKLDSLSVLKCF